MRRARKVLDAGRLAAEVLLRPTQRHTLPVLALFITERCEGRCVSCPIHRGEGSHQLSLARIRALREDAVRLGARIALVSGGEPLLHPDLVSIVEDLEQVGDLRVNLSTSGARLDAAMARRLGQAGLTAACVSVESPDPEVHDALRGPGTHAEALAAVSHLREHAPSVKVSLGLTISRANLDTLPGMPALVHGLGAHSLRVQLVRDGFEQTGLRGEVFEKLRIHPSQSDTLRRQLERTQQRATELGVRTDSPTYMDDLCEAVLHHRHTRCVAGELTASVHARGVIKPCPNLDVELPLEDGLVAAWGSAAFAAHRAAPCSEQCGCTDSTYHNLSVVLERLRRGHLASVARDAVYYSLNR